MWQKYRIRYTVPFLLPVHSNASVVFLDAPILLQPGEVPEWATSLQALDSIQAPLGEPGLQPRAWWLANVGGTICHHVPQTMEYLGNYLKDQKFNVSSIEYQLIRGNQ
jgi:hypothetical protein